MKVIVAQHDLKDDTGAVPSPKKLGDINKIREFLDDIEPYLEKKRGIHGSPLAYVIRKYEWLDQIAMTLPDGPFSSINEEIITHTKLSGAMYDADNITVFNVIHNVFHKTAQWSWIQPHTKSRNR